MCAYRLRQIPDKLQHVQTVVKDVEVAEQKMSFIKPVSGPVEATVDVIGVANVVVAQVVTISEKYLEPLRIFNAVVTGIGNVRPFN